MGINVTSNQLKSSLLLWLLLGLGNCLTFCCLLYLFRWKSQFSGLCIFANIWMCQRM